MSTIKKLSRKLKKFFNKPKTQEALKEAQREFRDFLRDPGIVASILRSWIAGRLIESGISSNKANAAIASVWDEYVKLVRAGDVPTSATEKIAVTRLLGIMNDPDTRTLLVAFLTGKGFIASDAVLLVNLMLKQLATLASIIV